LKTFSASSKLSSIIKDSLKGLGLTETIGVSAFEVMPKLNILLPVLFPPYLLTKNSEGNLIAKRL
jgi:hypothetical protein